MTLPEAQWSKDNPAPIPVTHKGPITAEQIQAAVDRAADSHQQANEKDKAGMSPDERKRTAAEMREQAARIERGT